MTSLGRLGAMGRGFGKPGGGGGGSSVPGWVLSGASIDMDFANGLYFGGTLASLLSVSRASSKTNLLPTSASGFAYSSFLSNVLAVTSTLGALIEEARTNVLLNSTAPVTQTTASLGTGVYTLWVNGSGSALASAGTATITGASSATNGSPNVITVTVAGTVTVTVTGSLNFFQLEAGATGTSGIVTAGATATRAADNIQAAGLLLSTAAAASMTLFVQTNALMGTAGTARIWGSNGNSAILFMNTATQIAQYDGSFVTAATFGSGNFSGVGKHGFATDNVTTSIVANNGTVVTATDTWTRTQGFIGSQSGSSNFANGYIQRITVYGSRLSDTALKALTA